MQVTSCFFFPNTKSHYYACDLTFHHSMPILRNDNAPSRNYCSRVPVKAGMQEPGMEPGTVWKGSHVVCPVMLYAWCLWMGVGLFELVSSCCHMPALPWRDSQGSRTCMGHSQPSPTLHVPLGQDRRILAPRFFSYYVFPIDHE